MINNYKKIAGRNKWANIAMILESWAIVAVVTCVVVWVVASTIHANRLDVSTMDCSAIATNITKITFDDGKTVICK